MGLVWSAVLACSVAGAACVDDDETKKPDRTVTQAEVEALVDLANRVRKLEAAAQEKQPGAAGQTWNASKMLTFSTPDGNFTAKIGGRLYFVYRHIFDGFGSTTNAKDAFLIDSARFQLDGTFFKDFTYRVEGEAKSGETVNGVLSTGFFRTKDAYLGWQGLGDWFALQAGQFKCPMSQEETCSSRFIDFAERSVLNRLVPGHVQGIMAKGSLFENTFEWWLGYGNGAFVRDGDRGTLDSNDEKDGFGRFFLTPLKSTDIGFLKTVRLGYDFTIGKRDGQPPAAPNDISSGDLGLPVLIDYTGGQVNGRMVRQDFNFNWNYGPMNLRAEYFRSKTELEGSTANSAFHQRAFYISAAYVLTGEEKPLESRIRPKNNFDPADGGWGAWEVALRWAVIDGKDARHAGVIANNGTKNAGGANGQTGATEYTIGVNWWMAPNVVVRITYERLVYDLDVPVGKNGAFKRFEDEIYIRWQIDF